MSRLKIILLSDSSKFIHLAITQSLFILSKQSYLAIILLIVELAFLFKQSKNLLIYSLVLISFISVRFDQFNQVNEYNTGTVYKVEEKRVVVKNKELFYLYVEDTSQYEVGMNLEFDSKKFDTDYKNVINNFDYKTYLLSKNILVELRAEEVKVIGRSFSLRIIQDKIKQYFLSNYDENISSYLNLFILGDKTEIEADVIDGTTRLGINHLFAISGMHIGLMITFLNLLMAKLYLRTKTHRRIIIGFLLIYNIITAFSITILRASLLSISLFFVKDKSFTKLDYLSFILTAFLVYNPYYLFNVGFVLSFLVSFSIILGRKFWSHDQKIIQIFKVGVLAYVISLPVILKLNNYIGVFNLIYNVVFVLFVSYLFLPLIFLVIVLPFMKSILSLVIISFENLIKIASDFNLYFEFRFTNEVFAFIYWSIIIAFLISNYKYKERIVIGSLILLVLINKNIHLLTSFSYIRIIDVNQADSIHLHNGKCDILIDTGNKDNYDTVINYFHGNNIKQLDMLIISHFHADHYGELEDIINNLKVEKLVVNRYNSSLSFDNQVEVTEGDMLYCGDFKLMALNSYNSNNENNNALVLYSNIYGNNWLFTGDIDSEIEGLLLEKYQLKIDYLKVAHHGSITSSDMTFLKEIDPKIAVVSVGKNTYGHPSQDVLNRFNSLSTSVYRTDEVGSITFYFNKITKITLSETFLMGERKKYKLIN